MPRASRRPATSKRRSRATSGSGRSTHMSYSDGRACRAISMTSRWPSEVMRATRPPRRSSRALVATVVPWAITAVPPPGRRPPQPDGRGLQAPRPRLTTSPVSVTTSVNVPPVSTPTRATTVGFAKAGRSGPPRSSGDPVAGPAPLSVGRVDGEPVDEIVHGVPAVALDPSETDQVRAWPGRRDQRLPEIPVGDRLLLAVLPAPGQPPLPPAVPEAVDHVGRIAHHLERPPRVVTASRAAWISMRWLVVCAAAPLAYAPSGHGPRPPTRTGVPQAGPVGVDNGRLVAQCSTGTDTDVAGPSSDPGM